MTHTLWPLDLFAHDPWLYSCVFFLYSLATALFLPLPVEVGLLNDKVHWLVLVLVLGLGKATGSVLVFRLGMKMEEQVDKWLKRFPRAKPVIDAAEAFVAKYGYGALFVLLVIPGMTDTVPLYLFSILNPSLAAEAKGEKGAEGKAVETPARTPHALRLLPFVAVNFVAGVVRGILFLVLFTDVL